MNNNQIDATGSSSFHFPMTNEEVLMENIPEERQGPSLIMRPQVTNLLKVYKALKDQEVNFKITNGRPNTRWDCPAESCHGIWVIRSDPCMGPRMSLRTAPCMCPAITIPPPEQYYCGGSITADSAEKLRSKLLRHFFREQKVGIIQFRVNPPKNFDESSMHFTDDTTYEHDDNKSDLVRAHIEKNPRKTKKMCHAQRNESGFYGELVDNRWFGVIILEMKVHPETGADLASTLYFPQTIPDAKKAAKHLIIDACPVVPFAPLQEIEICALCMINNADIALKCVLRNCRTRLCFRCLQCQLGQRPSELKEYAEILPADAGIRCYICRQHSCREYCPIGQDEIRLQIKLPLGFVAQRPFYSISELHEIAWAFDIMAYPIWETIAKYDKEKKDAQQSLNATAFQEGYDEAVAAQTLQFEEKKRNAEYMLGTCRLPRWANDAFREHPVPKNCPVSNQASIGRYLDAFDRGECPDHPDIVLAGSVPEQLVKNGPAQRLAKRYSNALEVMMEEMNNVVDQDIGQGINHVHSGLTTIGTISTDGGADDSTYTASSSQQS